jgi:hypothetical protein
MNGFRAIAAHAPNGFVLTRSLAIVLVGALVSALAVGCGQDVVLGDGRALDDDASDAGHDAGVRDADLPDADLPDAGWNVPRFSEPVMIEALVGDSDEGEDDPTLNRERTWIFFNSTRVGGLGREDVWFSQRASASDTWSAPQPATALNSEARESGAAVSADGLTIYWSSDREGGAGGLDIYAATRRSLDEPWSEPLAMDVLNSSDDDLVSGLVDNERRVLFARRDGDSDYALWWAQRDNRSDSWSAPEPIRELNASGAESDPFLVGEGTLLLFSRGGDLHLARRGDQGAAFSEEQPLSTLNSDAGDTDAWSDEALSYIVFASTRSGESRLYEATYEPEREP